MKDEEIQNNETNEEGTQTDPSDSLFERTNKATARQEEANKKTEELLNRQEQLYMKQKLGGQSNAGEKEEVVKEISDIDYAKKAMAGEIDVKED